MIQTLDVKGLNCPLPILRTRKAIRGLSAGDVLHVLATDPGSLSDFQTYCQTTGNQLMEWNEQDGIYSFTIRKAA